MYFSITCFILPSPLLDAHAFADVTIDMVHENYFMTQFLQKMFRHHSFGNSSRQGRIILLQRNSNLLFAVFLTIL